MLWDGKEVDLAGERKLLFLAGALEGGDNLERQKSMKVEVQVAVHSSHHVPS